METELIKMLDDEQNCIDTLAEKHAISCDDTAKIGEESIIFLKRNNGKTIKFLGQLVAKVENNPAFKGHHAKIKLKIFKTKKNRYVCQLEYFNNGIEKIGALCGSAEKVRAFFGNGEFAQELYFEAGFDDVKQIA